MKNKDKKIGNIRIFSRFIVITIVSFLVIICLCFFSSCALLSKKSPEKCVEIGKKYYDKKDYVKSEKYYSQAININPVLYNAYWERANTYIAMDSLEKSIDDMSKYIESNPSVLLLEKAYIQRAKILLKLGYKADACEDFDNSCKLNKDNAPYACEQYRLNCK